VSVQAVAAGACAR